MSGGVPPPDTSEIGVLQVPGGHTCGTTGLGEAPCRRLGAGETCVIVVIVLLAGFLAVIGLELAEIAALLGAAGMTAAAVVVVCTGRGPGLQVLPVAPA